MSETRLIPRLVVTDADAAIRFYAAAFGATEVVRHGGDGKVVHAELSLSGAPLYLKDADAFDEPTRTLLSLTVPDSDTTFAAAVAAGATVIFPLATQFYGERGGRVQDPFGHQWIVSTVVEVLSPDEMERRLAENL